MATRRTNAIDPGRRLLLGTAALGVAAAPLRFVDAAGAQAHATRTPMPTHAANATFANIKQVRAGVLEIGYAEDGPKQGPPVVLLHGWPYDIHAFVDVAPRLAARGYRVLVPFVRGHGTTRFLAPDTPRNAQPAALADDAVLFMEALDIQQAMIGGFD